MNALDAVRKAVLEHLPAGGFAIDATAGRGGDTVFLARTVGETGRVLAFDIQEEAVESTRARLKAEGLTNARVVLASHADMADYAEPESVDCILFNLGYLPGGDHSVYTRADSTCRAITAGLGLLKRGGLMCVTWKRCVISVVSSRPAGMKVVPMDWRKVVQRVVRKVVRKVAQRVARKVARKVVQRVARKASRRPR